MASGPHSLAVSADCVSVGWICATTLEHSAARNHFDERLALARRQDDDAPFMLDVGLISGHVVAVICLVSSEDPIHAAPRAAHWLASTFPNIRIRLSVGIGSAVPTFEKDLRLGDVVVSASTHKSRRGIVAYDAGAPFEDSVKIAQHFAKPPDNLFRAVMRVHVERKQLDYTRSLGTYLNDAASKLQAPYGQRPPAHSDKLHCIRHPHSSPTSACRHCDPREGIIRDRPVRDDLAPRVHHGLIASHVDSVKDAKLRETIVRGIHRKSGLKILCFDKTAASLLSHFDCLVIRGVADYADAHGNSVWRDWAALAAAAYAKELLASISPHEHEHDRRGDEIHFYNDPSATMPGYPESPPIPANQHSKPTLSRASSSSQRRGPDRSSSVACMSCGHRYQRSALIRRDERGCYCWKCDMSRSQAGAGIPHRVLDLATSVQEMSSNASLLSSPSENWSGTPRRGRSRQQSLTLTDPTRASPFSSRDSGDVENSSKLYQKARMDNEVLRFMGSPDIGDPYERPSELDFDTAEEGYGPQARARETGHQTAIPVRIRAPTPPRSSRDDRRGNDTSEQSWFPGYRPGLTVREFRQIMRPAVVFPETGDRSAAPCLAQTAPLLFNRPRARQPRDEPQQHSTTVASPPPPVERQNSFAEIAMRGVGENARLSMEASRPPRPQNTAPQPPSRRTTTRPRPSRDERDKYSEPQHRQRRPPSTTARGGVGASPYPRDIVLRGQRAQDRQERMSGSSPRTQRRTGSSEEYEQGRRQRGEYRPRPPPLPPVNERRRGT